MERPKTKGKQNLEPNLRPAVDGRSFGRIDPASSSEDRYEEYRTESEMEESG